MTTNLPDQSDKAERPTPDNPNPSPSTPSALDAFKSQYLPLIESELNEQLASYDNKDAILKAIDGGKRLRALLAFLVYKANNGTDDKKGAKVAASMELAHNASLIKDDMLDKDPQRRGKPSQWVQSGPMEAMRTADTMLAATIEGLADFGADFVKTFLSGWRTAWQGEAQDYSVISGLQKINGPFYNAYFKIIKRKTASLFAISAKLGAQAAETPAEQIEMMRLYGEGVGVAYQLTDDYVDLKKGKLELLPILAMAQFDVNLKQQVLGLLGQGRMNISEALMGTGINIEQFLKENLRQQLKKINTDVDDLNVANKYKILLKDFPHSAALAMLAEIKAGEVLE